MAPKKPDFEAVAENSIVFQAINTATSELTTKDGRAERKTYEEEEKEYYMNNLQTAGRKGCKLPRINMAFTPEVYDFIKTMSRVRGQSMTEFINHIMQQVLEEQRDTYEKAKAFRDSF